jgi:ABC-type glycerol-3-phosphate transport system substrate-binding protein
VIMAARQDILDKHGIKPEDVSNWESFSRVCMELSAYSKSISTRDDMHFPLIFRIRPESDTFWYYVSWLWSAGWRFPSMIPAPDRILNDDAAIRTFEYIFKLMENSGITTKDVSIHPQHMFEQFHNQGRYVFYIGNWGGPLANIVKNSLNSYASDASSSYTIMPLPTATPNARPWSGGSALVVSKGTKNQESAWNLVEYLISDDFIKKWTSVSGDVPAYECPFWERNASDANLKVLRSQMEKSDTFPFHPMWYSIEKKIEDGIANLLWSTLEGKAPGTLENIRSGFVETDRNVCELLKMSWEMEDGD